MSGPAGHRADDGWTRETPEAPGFEIVALVGRGAHSSVWRARRRRDGLECVLKVLVTARDLDVVVREATLLRQARHEHVVTLHDVIVVIDADGARRAALVLQAADAGSLAELMDGRGVLSPGETVTAVAPIAQALAALHRIGVVHGDLSASNIVLTGAGVPLLADLGAAQLVAGDSVDLWGTPGFAAPEIVGQGHPGPAADVFALGVLIWLGLSGSMPPARVSVGDADEVMPASVPARLSDLLEACLSWDPQSRPDAGEVARRLLEAAEPEPLQIVRGSAASLTRRLREMARESPWGSDDAAEEVTWWRRWKARRRHGRQLRELAAQQPVLRPPDASDGPTPPPPRPGAGRRGGSHRLDEPGNTRPLRRLGFGMAGAGLAVLLAWAVVVLMPAVRQPDHRLTSGATTAAPSEPAPTDPQDRASAMAVSSGLDPDPAAEAVKALPGLAASRARAWAGEAQLSASLVPGSPAMAADQIAVREVRGAGARFENLSFAVERVVVLRSSRDAVTVRADIRRSAFRVVMTGSNSATRTEESQTSELELRRTSQGWRIARMRPVTTT